MSLNLADSFLFFFYFWSGLPTFTQEVQRVMGVVHWTKFYPMDIVETKGPVVQNTG
jgi:hypothetical protein